MAMDKIYSLRRYKSQSVFLYDCVMRPSFALARKSTTEVTRYTLVESCEYLRREEVRKISSVTLIVPATTGYYTSSTVSAHVSSTSI
jgi:hypothetical protein